MSLRAFNILKAINGKEATINGTTHIRAGVIRPEIISIANTKDDSDIAIINYDLKVGKKIRIVSSPYFCKLAKVINIPNMPEKIPSGTYARVLHAKLEETGEIVKIPRANIEVIQG